MFLLLERDKIIDIVDSYIIDDTVIEVTKGKKKLRYRNEFEIIEVESIPSGIKAQKYKYTNGEFTFNEDYTVPEL